MDNRQHYRMESMGEDQPTGKIRVVRKPNVPVRPIEPIVSGVVIPQDQGSGMSAPAAPDNEATTVLFPQAKNTSQPSVVGQKNKREKRKKLNGRIVAISLLLLVLLAGAGTAGWWWFELKPKALSNVTLYTAHMQTVAQSIGGGGITFPLQQVDITYPASERVIALKVKAGDQVAANQSLMQLDTAQLDVQIKQAADDVAAAQAYLNTVSASGNAVQIAQAQQQYDVATNRYNALVAQASSPLVHDGILTSPMSGTVTSVNVNAGQQFAPNTALLTIMDESTIIVHAKIPLIDLNQVHIGQHVSISPSALPDITEQGTVSQIIPQADPQTDTFDAWVAIINKDHQLVPGMSTFVHIETSGQALVLPRLAVLSPDTNPQVFVVGSDQHVAHLRYVHVVGRSVQSIFIDKGLSAGERVVLVGLDGLQDGQSIRVTRIYG